MFNDIYIKFTGGVAVAVILLVVGCALSLTWEVTKFIFKAVMMCLMRN